MLLSGQPQPASPVVLPPRSPTCVSPHAHPPVLAGAAGVARLVGVARVLGLGVHGVRTPRLVALQGHRLGPSGGPPCHLLQHWLLQAKGHLQEINRHPEGLYFAGQVGLSQRKSSGAPEEKKQLVRVGLELSVGSEHRGRPCPGSSRRTLGRTFCDLRCLKHVSKEVPGSRWTCPVGLGYYSHGEGHGQRKVRVGRFKA